MTKKILKCHGSGNDFILIDEVADNDWDIPEPARAVLARTFCDRDSGIGADGVLYYMAGENADCRMRMFNPDGSEAEMCGNGLRCVGRYCAEELRKRSVAVETMKAILTVERADPMFDGVETFEAQIGPVSLRPQSLPMITGLDEFTNQRLPQLADGLVFSALSVPNPHLVTIVDDIDERQVERCGIAANDSPVFPNGVNLSFVQSLGADRIYVVTYERGVGITDSCGTAMSASAYVSARNGLTNAKQPIQVFNNGGMVVIEVSSGTGELLLKGNATFVFEAALEISEDYGSIHRPYTEYHKGNEIEAYAKLRDYARSVITAGASARRRQ